MDKKKPLLFRAVFYLFGLFLIACGAVFSIYSGLGTTPVSALPYAVSIATGIEFGSCATALFALYFFIQLILLRREFNRINILQLLCSVIFGILINVIKSTIDPFELQTYMGKLAVLFVSIIMSSFGLLFYLSARLISLPPEGIVLAFATKLKRPFHGIKIAFDITSVLLGCLITFAVLGHIDGIREGTAISAIATGKLLAVISKPLKPKLDKFLKTI